MYETPEEEKPETPDELLTRIFGPLPEPEPDPYAGEKPKEDAS